LRNSAGGYQHSPGLDSGRKLEGATLPSRVHYRQGRTGGATSDNVVFRAQPSEGGTSEATPARTVGPSVRRHGTRGPAAARTGLTGRSRSDVTPAEARTYEAASIRRRGLPAGGLHRGCRHQLTGRYVHTSISQTSTRQPGSSSHPWHVRSSKTMPYTTKFDKVGSCDADFAFSAISHFFCDLWARPVRRAAFLDGAGAPAYSNLLQDGSLRCSEGYG
jgi:hypothetical protein